MYLKDGNRTFFGRDDIDLIVAFAGCSLDESPGSNWVQKSGGLPEYICEIARAVKRSGKPASQAISIAVSRVKKWAAGVGVDKDTQAKAAAAVAEWEKLKAKNKSSAVKNKTEAKMSHTGDRLTLNLTDYPMDMVSGAWQARINQMQADYRKANPNQTSYYNDPDYPSSMWVKETWSSFIIVKSDYGRDADLYKVPYTVDDNQDVTFGDPVEVKQEYVEVTDDDAASGNNITDDQIKKMMAMTGPGSKHAIDRILALSSPQPTALHRIVSLPPNDKATKK